MQHWNRLFIGSYSSFLLMTESFRVLDHTTSRLHPHRVQFWYMVMFHCQPSEFQTMRKNRPSELQFQVSRFACWPTTESNDRATKYNDDEMKSITLFIIFRVLHLLPSFCRTIHIHQWIFTSWSVFRSNHVAVSLGVGVLKESCAVVHNRSFQR